MASASAAPPQLPSTSTSSGTLWATGSLDTYALLALKNLQAFDTAASKEWVIPAKPKPGRKPKKDPNAVEADKPMEVCADTQVIWVHSLKKHFFFREKAPGGVVRTGESIQSIHFSVTRCSTVTPVRRAAQRAFRERKQEQLAELQARLQQYEQGDIERNVALQAVAKRLKEDNEKLRLENDALKARVTQLEERGSHSNKRRESPFSFTPEFDQPARKRHRSQAADAFPSPTFSAATPYTPISVATPYSPIYVPPSPTSTSSIPDSSIGSLDHLPTFETQGRHVTDYSGAVYDPLFDFTSTGVYSPADAAAVEAAMQMNVFALSCAMCGQSSCGCAGLAAAAEQAATPPLKIEVDTDTFNFDLTMLPPTPESMPSILDNLPPYQPPVPLRRRTTNSNFKSVFPVAMPVSDCPVGTNGASCSGDPSNCLACKDDQFGQAFCAAIGQSLASSPPCANCPSQSTGATPGSGCCGNPAGCCRNSPSTISRTASPIAAPAPHLAGGAAQTIACDDAWRQIKASNPQVSFADLSLLAEVVARRSKCTGPRVVISPAPGAITPERAHMSPAMASRTVPGSDLFGSAPPAYQEQPSSVSIQCGKPSVRELPAEAVRDAMRLLEIMYPRNT